MDSVVKHIMCLNCNQEVPAYLTDGREIYPHRRDLSAKHFWKCPRCGEFVGCHPNTIEPLGSIPTQEIREARKKVHATIDPIWKEGVAKRGEIYGKLSKLIGKTYHTGNVSSTEEAEKIIAYLNEEYHDKIRQRRSEWYTDL